VLHGSSGKTGIELLVGPLVQQLFLAARVRAQRVEADSTLDSVHFMTGIGCTAHAMHRRATGSSSPGREPARR